VRKRLRERRPNRRWIRTFGELFCRLRGYIKEVTTALAPLHAACIDASQVADAEARALLARAQAGDAASVRALYGAHARYIAGVVHRIMGNDSDVDDVVQETFLDGLDALASLKEPMALRGWLATIAVRRVHRLLSRRRRRRVLMGIFFNVSPRSSEPEAGAPVFELYEALDGLPADLRIPWTLARLEGFLLHEVAAACAVSLATVKRRLKEAEARLQLTLGTMHASFHTSGRTSGDES
jgi:RNA polymerase sigma-70 factor, ECF subfamily